jgi:hypothetical protein
MKVTILLHLPIGLLAGAVPGAGHPRREIAANTAPPGRRPGTRLRDR